jgi:flagellar biosynthesis protein FliR
MGLATLAAVPLFEKTKFQKWVRLSLIANALVTPLICIVYFYPTYSYSLLVLGFPWAITAPLFMLMLALNFIERRADHNGSKKLNRPLRTLYNELS